MPWDEPRLAFELLRAETENNVDLLDGAQAIT
jgi:hypothetical protein